jgi:hypothetical protein
LDFFVVGETDEQRERNLHEFLILVGGSVSRTNKCYVDVVQDDGTRLQVIMTGLSSIREVVSGFDCTVSQMWLNKENQIECSHDAMECIQNNTNQFRSGRFVPRDRIEKYQELFKFNTIVSEGCIVLENPRPNVSQ